MSEEIAPVQNSSLEILSFELKIFLNFRNMDNFHFDFRFDFKIKVSKRFGLLLKRFNKTCVFLLTFFSSSL